jgi:hypothetical protein
MKAQTLAPIFLLFVLIAAASNLAVSVANPLIATEIEVTSPQNNRVYSTGDVWLQFTKINVP